MAKKKPTIKELAKQVEFLMQNMEIARVRILNIESLLSKYFEYKKDEEKFKEYLDKEAEKLDKDRASDSVRDDKQQVVSSSKGCY